MTTVPLTVTAITDVSYRHESGKLTLTAVFNTSDDAPLNTVAAASAAKWNARYLNLRFHGQTLTLLNGSRIQVVLGQAGTDTGADELNYTNAPSDIADATGRKLTAFGMGF